ncbi:YfgM family protein [Pseudoalteromonas denitrificans]|jgi:predicted negative regulator of RcsB-dependent stress response|uniref:Ancillary SecYEG translocon subunit n=1 Tax=Pseudoalteromonas denitrificans DSM 6059 TaxID=1123010 RepID=A0A1I1L4I6_9GAMM|nr:tetratricopeptide repeat protein [Pseudoalteromonas denitrificans]SFC67954.1 Putative negative regulator of RcsB-dependent stress response [Pseudoalteromonas denitrificans DSM 6059]
MEIFSTEEEQAEAIKGFFRDNGIALAIGVVLGLGGLYGWRAYNQHTVDTTELTSDSYTKLVEKAGQEGSSLLADADTFIENNSGSSYAILAAFVTAKEAVDKNELDTAAEKLIWISTNTNNIEFKALAFTRLARIQLEQKKFDEALTTLGNTLPISFEATVAELKGDVYVAKNDLEQARKSYQVAVDAGGSENNTLLQIKLDNLAVVALNVPVSDK